MIHRAFQTSIRCNGIFNQSAMFSDKYRENNIFEIIHDGNERNFDN